MNKIFFAMILWQSTGVLQVPKVRALTSLVSPLHPLFWHPLVCCPESKNSFLFICKESLVQISYMTQPIPHSKQQNWPKTRSPVLKYSLLSIKLWGYSNATEKSGKYKKHGHKGTYLKPYSQIFFDLAYLDLWISLVVVSVF